MLHDADAIPSQVSAVYWIEAKRQPDDYPAPTSNAGYWLISTTLHDVDALWAKIKQATESGILGYKSKVSTSAGRLQSGTDSRVIHVCTYDSTDSADVERVEKSLRHIGIEIALHYQSD